MQVPPARAPPGRIFQTFGRTTRRVEYPYHPPLGRGSRGLRPLYCPWSRFCYPTSSVAALFLPHQVASYSVLGSPASLIGSELSRTGLRPFVVDRNICNVCVVW